MVGDVGENRTVWCMVREGRVVHGGMVASRSGAQRTGVGQGLREYPWHLARGEFVDAPPVHANALVRAIGDSVLAVGQLERLARVRQ